MLQISGRCDATTGIDVVFVHGTETDAESCWHPSGHPEFSMPRMLARDLLYACCWSLSYESSLYRRKAHTLPLAEQATSAIKELATRSIGRGPVVFVAHSVGGLLVKHILQLARTSQNMEWRTILDQTTGVVFLATPHFEHPLTSFMSMVLRRMPMLQKSLISDTTDPKALLALNRNFQEIVAERSINVDAYYEGRRTRRRIWLGFLVSKEQANPQIPNVTPTVVNADHDGICKPQSQDDPVYRSVRKFVRECFAGPKKGIFVSYAHEDIATVKQLKEHLDSLTNDESPHIWIDEEIRAGEAWATDILKHLESARVAVLHISAAFLSSDYIRHTEVPNLRRNADTEGLVLICVPVSHFDPGKLSFRYDMPQGGEKSFDLTDLQWAGSPERTLADMPEDKKQAFLAKLASDILKAADPGQAYK